MLDSLHKNHYVFLIGDFNVDISPAIETTAAVEELDLHKVPTKITLGKTLEGHDPYITK